MTHPRQTYQQWLESTLSPMGVCRSGEACRGLQMLGGERERESINEFVCVVVVGAVIAAAAAALLFSSASSFLESVVSVCVMV
jgi:hypothetical protein